MHALRMWRCEHARFCAEICMRHIYIFIYPFIRPICASLMPSSLILYVTV